MEKILEKKEKKYVLAAIEGSYCYYLKLNHHKVPGQFVADSSFEMVTDIVYATKSEKKSIMRSVLERYQNAVGDEALEFVILPVEITYELIKEID